MPNNGSARELIGPKPAGAVRAVSLAVRDYLRRYRPDGLVLAVSGGADSLALAAAALDLAGRAGIPVLTVTVDHGIRAGSGQEAERVALSLKELGADEAVVASGSGRPGGAGPEGDARTLRYRELVGAAQEFQSRRDLAQVDLLLGHTLDDQAETVLLRLARGASSAALGAMRRRLPAPLGGGSGLWLGRPLLSLRRTETEGCCRALGLPAVQDPTNAADGPWRSADGSPLRRAAVRQWALPLLSRILRQDVAPALARVADQLQEDEDALQVWVDAVLEESTSARDGKPGLPEGALCRIAPLAEAPTAIRRRALRSLALGRGVPGGSLSAPQIAALDALVHSWKGQGPVSLPGGLRVGRDGPHLRVFLGPLS